MFYIVLKDDSDESEQGLELYHNVTESVATEFNKYIKMKPIDINDAPITF